MPQKVTGDKSHIEISRRGGMHTKRRLGMAHYKKIGADGAQTFRAKFPSEEAYKAYMGKLSRKGVKAHRGKKASKAVSRGR